MSTKRRSLFLPAILCAVLGLAPSVIVGPAIAAEPMIAQTVGETSSFTDVRPTDQFYKEISWLAAEDISRGWPDGTFKPLMPVNRDAMAAFMYRLSGKPAYTPPARSEFKDVATSNIFYKEISWLAAQDISRGWPDGTFKPLSPVNRDAMAAFMYRLSGKPAYTPPARSEFKDVATSNIFYKEISWLAAEDISRGWPDGTFKPLSPVNRDAMAAFMYRFDARGSDAPALPTLNEQRAALREQVRSAKQDYVDSRPYVASLARENGLAVKKAIEDGTAALLKADNLVTQGTTGPTLAVAAAAVRREETRADTVLRSATQLNSLKGLREVHRQVAVKALADLQGKRITSASYQATKARAEAFSTLLAADTANQLRVMGTVSSVQSLQATAWKDELEKKAGTIPSAAGWVGFPGGCALPKADPKFTPQPPTTGPSVATNSRLVANAKVRGATDPSLSAIHAQMLRAATSQAAQTLTLDQLRSGYVPRIARLGYGWLEADNIKARDALRSDTKRVLEAGPESMSSLSSSHLLIAAGTAADWSSAEGLDETVLVRWLGPYTCMQADRESFVEGPTNISTIHDTASFIAASVFLEDAPEQSAALAQESLVSIQPAIRAITNDGGTGEGPGYWTYQSRALATLYSTLPNVYAQSPVSMPSLQKVSDYALNSTNPNDIATPFADGLPQELSPLMPAWDAYSRNDPKVAAWVSKELVKKPDAYLMWWWAKPGALQAKSSRVYPETGLAALQRPGVTATLKGGNNSVNHAHLDLGTLSFHRNGVQWAVDPGAPVSAPAGYYSDYDRWKFWWPSTVAHSTLMRGTSNQPVTAKAPVTMLSPSSASANLVQALPGASSATRTVTHNATNLVVKDSVRAGTSMPLTWQWITAASVSVDANAKRAVLRQDSKQVSMKFDGAPAGSTLTAVAAPQKGPGGQPLTVIRLSMPNVTALNLTTTVW